MPQPYFDPRSLGAPLPGSPAGPPPTGVTPGIPFRGGEDNLMLGKQFGGAMGFPPPVPTATPSPSPTGAPTPAPVNGADMLSTFALVPQTPITPPQSPYSPRVAQSGELGDLLNQSPETQFLGKPTPPPSPTPAPMKKPNQYAV